MELLKVFQVSMYGLACFASLILALAEGSPLPALTIPIGVAALIFSERWRVVQLPPLWANSLGIGAFLLAGAEFFSDNPEGRLLSGAHLLVYLSWIVLFQEKNERQYWSMCALGLLQVAVASVLTSGGWFGLLLVCYLFAGLWTLSVFSLYRAHQHFDNIHQYAVSIGNTGASLGASPAIDRPLIRSAAIGATTVQPHPRASTTRRAVHRDTNDRWINGRFVAAITFLAVAALAIGAAFFLFVPRIWIGQWSAFGDRPVPGRKSLTGFTGEVHLGDIGQILESTESVLEIRIFDDQTNRELDVRDYAQRLGYDEPMFRGTVLRIYQNGRWFADTSPLEYKLLRSNSPRARGAGIIRQEIQLQPVGADILFALPPVLNCRIENSRSRIRKHFETQVLKFQPNDHAPCEYTVHSAASTNQQSTGARPRIPISDELRQYCEQYGEFQKYRQLPTGLERLKRLAREVAVPKSASEPLPETEMATRLEKYLQESGEFSYSLDLSIHDPAIDPVEDFLFNRKTGHCEYFASALTLMLRAVNIPARLVSGFKGGDPIGKHLEIQQRHAHAWVEAYVDGNWIVFDPTPASRQASVDNLAPNLRSWNDFQRRLSNFWTRDVVQMSLSRQQNAIYDPMKQWWTNWNQLQTELPNLLFNTPQWLSSPSRWFSWQGGLTAFVLLLTATGLVHLIKKGVRLLKELRSRLDERRTRNITRVEFYERFQKILAEQGLVRQASQTQQEFAQQSRSSLKRSLLAAGLSEFPTELIEYFYRVRFGAMNLAPEEVRKLDRQLSQLEQCLAYATNNPA